MSNAVISRHAGIYTQPAPLDVQQRYGIDEACAFLRVSKATLHRQIASGAIKTLKVGRRTFIPGSEIVAQSRIA